MVKKKSNIDDNQIELNDVCEGFYEATNEKNKNRDIEENKINYKEEILKLNKKINDLTDIVNTFQGAIEKIISLSSDENIREMTSDIERENHNKKELKVYLTRGGERLNGKGIQETKAQYHTPKPIVDLVSKMGENQIQNELPFLKNKSSLIGGATGSLFAGVGGALIGSAIGSKMFSTTPKDIDTGINGITREFLVNNPIQSYEEFVKRLKILNPNLTDKIIYRMSELLEFDLGDLKSYNDFLIEGYDELKSKLLEKERIINSIPYIQYDFSLYTLSNNIKEILKTRGISMEKLTDLIGVSKNTMTAIVNNKGTSAVNMLKISMVFGLPVEEIFKYEPMIDKVIRESTELNAELNK